MKDLITLKKGNVFIISTWWFERMVISFIVVPVVEIFFRKKDEIMKQINLFKLHLIFLQSEVIFSYDSFLLTLSCIIFKNGETYFKNLAVRTPENF